MNMAEQEEAYDDHRELETDEHITYAQSNRSRYFFAMMSFLVTLIFLSAYLNNFYGLLSGWLLLLGAFAFGAVGAFFLLPRSVLNRTMSTGRNSLSSEGDNNVIEADTDDSIGEGDDADEGGLSSFELPFETIQHILHLMKAVEQRNFLLDLENEVCDHFIWVCFARILGMQLGPLCEMYQFSIWQFHE
jgi:hypothetical protein